MAESKRSITGTIYGFDEKGPYKQKRGEEKQRLGCLVFASWGVLQEEYKRFTSSGVLQEDEIKMKEAQREFISSIESLGEGRFNGTPIHAFYINPSGKLKISKIKIDTDKLVEEILSENPDEETPRDPDTSPIRLG